ncbi:hypothetical protein [Cytobacillus sp. FSL H8-0458]|uniref:hypothetical protein n=1 Tax=Cytobacillus sp. FSL H8-0458 TaxID=2975346 RepID=UPI0030FCAD6A
MQAFLNLERARQEISKKEKEIEDLKSFIDLVENYEADTIEKLIIKEYALVGNVAKVATKLNEEGHRLEGGKKYIPNDITAIIQSKDTIDDLHSIVKKVSKKNKAKANRQWN